MLKAAKGFFGRRMSQSKALERSVQLTAGCLTAGQSCESCVIECRQRA